MLKTFNFDLVFLKRFGKLLINLNSYGSTFALLTFLLLLAILQEIAIYNVGMITGAYYKILGEKNKHQFWVQTIQSSLLIIALALIKSFKEYVASTIYIEWRQKLTKKIHSLYFMGLSYYRLNVIKTEKDNLDQRITQDVEKMCQHLSLVLPDLIVSPFTIAFYTYRSYATIGYIGPTGCVAFFVISTIINKSLMSPIVNLVYSQEKCEGNFRYQHLHVRNNAESIAFLNGDNFEYDKSEKTLEKLISVQENLILKELYLKSSVYLFDYFGSIISFIILSFPLFAGSYDSLSATDLSQLISQNAFVSIYLINCFTRLIDTSVQFTTIGGTTHRISELIEILSCKRHPLERNASTFSALKLRNDYSQGINESRIYFKLTNVGIKVPQTDRRLISKLNFQVSKGSNLLISGASGTCKTSILRVLKGIWDESSGTVERFIPVEDSNVVFFLPQKPVMTTGCLLEVYIDFNLFLIHLIFAYFLKISKILFIKIKLLIIANNLSFEI